MTDWVLELMQLAGKDPTLPQNHNLVVTASGTPAIGALAPIEYRSSQAGMDLELNLGDLVLQNTNPVTFMRSLAAFQSKDKATVSKFRVFQPELYSAYLSAIAGSPDEPRLRSLIAFESSQVVTSTTLHIDFAPPAMPTLDSSEAEILRSESAQLGKVLKITSVDSSFQRPLPIIGLTDSLPPELRNAQEQYTLADLSDIDTRLQALFNSLASAPTSMVDLEQLTARLATVPGVSSVTWTETESRVDFKIQYLAITNKNLTLKLGDAARRQRLSSATIPSESLRVETTTQGQFTIGLDRTPVSQGGKPVVDLTIDQLSARAVNRTATGAQPMAAFILKNGLLDMSVLGATVDFEAQIMLARRANQPRINLESLGANSLSTLIQSTPTGHANATLPVSASFAGLPASTIQLVQGNVFVGDPRVEFGSTSCLRDWSNFGIEMLGDVLHNIENTLGDIERTPELNAKTPVGPTTLPAFSQVFPLSQIWKDLTGVAFNAAGQLTATSIQGFVSQLNLPLVSFDQSTCSLMLGFGISKQLSLLNQPFNLSKTIGALGGISAGANLNIQTDGEFLFKVGIDLRAPGHDLAFGQGTPLDQLQGDRNPLAAEQGYKNPDNLNDIQIQLSNGANINLNFHDLALAPQAASLGSVRDLILAGGNSDLIDVEFDDTLKRIVLTDKTRGISRPFAVVALQNPNLVGPNGFGIAGSSSDVEADGYQRIRGTPIHGDDIRKHVFIAGGADIPHISATFTVSAANIHGLANYGMVGVGIDQGTLNLKLQLDARLRDPNADGRLTLSEISGGVKMPTNPVDPASIFQAIQYGFPSSPVNEMRLPIDAQLNGQSLFAAGAGTHPSLVVKWANYNEAPAVTFEGDMAGLTNYARLTIDAICDRLIQAIRNFGENKLWPDGTLPIDSPKLNEVLRIDSLLTAIQNAKSSELQDLAGKLNSAFASVFDPPSAPSPAAPVGAAPSALLPAQLPALLTVPYITLTRPNANELKLSLNLPVTFVRAAKSLRLDLEQLGLANAGQLVDLDAQGDITVDAGATLRVDLGFDIPLDSAGDAVEPNVFLYDTSGVDVTLSANSQNIRLKASVLGLGLEVRSGAISLDRDGPGPSHAPALLTIGYVPGSGKHYFTSNLFSDIGIVTASGGLDIDLPVFKTSTGQPLDPAKPALKVSSTDLADLPNSLSYDLPDLQGLADDLNIVGDFSGLPDGIDSLFGIIDTAVDAVAFASKLPIVGDQLKDAADLITRVRNETKAKLTSAGTQSLKAVRDVLHSALGPSGLGLLGGDHSPSMIKILIDSVPFDVDTQSINSIPQDVRFVFDLEQKLVDAALPVNFDIGIPLLALDLQGKVRLQIGGSWHVGLGISRGEGFYIDTSATDELVFEVKATLENFQAKGTLAFLEIAATDHAPNNEQQRTRLGGRFTVDLKGGGDNKLTIGEIGSLSFDQMVSARFVGGINVDLDLRTTFAGNSALPNLHSEFLLQWQLDTGAPSPSEPLIGFINNYLDAGSAINNLISPYLKQLKDVLGPIGVASDILTTPIPLISELAGDGFTLLRVIRLVAEVFVGPKTLESAEGVIRAVDKVLDLLKFLNANGEIQIKAPDFYLTDARKATSNDKLIPSDRNGNALPENVLENYLNGVPAVQNVLNATKSALQFIGGDAFPPPKFPILEKPSTVIGLLLGRDVDLITWGMPKVDMFTPIYVTSGLAALKGSTRLQANINVGMDTRGIRQFAKSGDFEDIFNGVYISDNVDKVTGVDVPEFQFDIDLLAAVGLISPPVSPYSPINVTVEVGVGGALQGSVHADVIDPNEDGKVYLDEMGHNLSNGFGCAFDLKGSIAAQLKAFLKIKGEIDLGFFSDEITLVDEEHIFTSFDWSLQTSCASSVPVDDALRPASLKNGNLELNTNASSERFLIEPRGDRAVKVTRWRGDASVSFEYEQVDKIFGDGKEGDDQIIIQPGVAIPAELHGGEGADTLQGGDGPDKLYGEAGDDVIRGGAGDDAIFAGLGNDQLAGDAGNDQIQGDEGDDRLVGGDGDDTLIGGDGQDQLFGDDGKDSLNGGTGDDKLVGGAGDDRLTGGLGNDQLNGDAGNDSLIAGTAESSGDSLPNMLIGGAGDDRLVGDGGDDAMWGDDLLNLFAGNDTIVGGNGNNVIYAGAGNDRINSGTGSDRIYAGKGDDTVDAGDGNDTVFGGDGNDQLTGGRGDDQMYGDAGNDRLYGGVGSDNLFGGDGDDVLQAGSPTDRNAPRGESSATHTLDGGSGRDTILGDFGVDMVTGGDGNDWIATFDGADVIDGGRGDDFIIAGRGSDRVAGGLGSDTIYAGLDENGGGAASDSNVVFGDLMDTDDSSEVGVRSGTDNQDTIFGDAGNDVLYGNTGDDQISALGGNNTVYAGWGSDTIYLASPGGGTNPRVENLLYADPQFAGGDGGDDTVFGSLGTDIVFTYGGADRITLFDGADQVESGSGDDQILGGKWQQTDNVGLRTR